MSIHDFIGEKVIYDKEGQMIFGTSIINDKALQLLLEVRGWGAIQNLFKDGKSYDLKSASELSMSSFMPKKHWRIGHIIDNPTEAANICDNTQIRVLTHIENTYGKTGVRGKIFGKPVIIWAKSPINDKQIHHHTVAIRLNDKVYLYDMPQSEFIKEISENKGEIVKEYTPRLIEYTHENLKKYYGTSNDNLAVQDEVILDNDILNLPTQITSQQKQQAQQIYSQYLDTIFPDSKIKDIVYHGSPSKHDVFKTIDENAREERFKHRGAMFTSDKNYVHAFGENLYSVILNIKNPKILSENTGINSAFVATQYYSVWNSESIDGVIGHDALLDLDHISEGTEYVVFEPEQIHILGSKQDIEGFKDFVQGKQERLNQVQELFNENPELANAVYEALGLNASEFQDELGKWIADAINEKLTRERR